MGKARIFSDSARESVYQKEFDDEVYNMSSQQGSYNLGSVHFSDQSGIANISQGGADQRKANLKGALFTGNLGFNLQTVKLDVATSTINLNNDSAGVALSVISTDRFVTLSTGTSSDLTTITGAQRPGQRLRLYNTLTNTITVKHTAAATVNTIRTSDTNDLTFPGNATLDLTFDITTAQWRVAGGTGGTGGGTTLPVVDTTSIVKGSVDATKLLRFEVDGNTTGITGVLASAFTTAKTVTLPDSTTTLAGLSTTQTFTSLNTFEAGIQLSDTSSNAHGLLQGIISEGVRLTLTSGEKFSVIDNITSILEVDSSTGLNVKTLDVTNVDRLQLSGGTTSVTSVSDVVWYLDSDGDLISNVNATDTWGWSAGNVIKMILSDSTLEKRNVTAPIFQLYNTRTAATGTAGTIHLLANSASISTGIAMASIVGATEVITGSGIGSMSLRVNLSGTATEFLTLNDSNDGNIKLLKDTALNSNELFFDTDKDTIISATTDDVLQFAVGGTVRMSITNTSILMAHNLAMSSSTIDLDGNSLILDQDQDTTITSSSDDSIQIVTGGSVRLAITNSLANFTVPIQMNSNDVLGMGGETINSLTADASPVSSTDFVMTYDASATALKKVLLSNLPSSSGANTALSNLASVAVNVALLPNGDGTLNLGSATLAWNDVFAERVRIEVGGSITNSANQIIADTGGMIFNTPDTDRFEFTINGQPVGIAIDDGEIQFLESGRQHKLSATATALQLISENETDGVDIFTGASRTNATLEINDTTTTWLTETDDIQAVLIQLIQNNNTPVDSRTVANIDFMAENSVSVDQIYGRISVSSQDVTDATEDGLMQLGVMSAGTVVSAMDIEGGTSSTDGAKISFYGQTPVARQTLSATPTNTELSTVLRNLGLTEL